MKTVKTPIIEIGPGSLKRLPDLLKQHGTKVLLVHGHRPVEDGLLRTVRLLLNEHGFPWADLGQILPDPKYGSVRRGIRAARKECCDMVLALGGGSTLQCAKGIALGLHYKGDVRDFWKGRKKAKKVCPIGSIMTNPASGQELSDSCKLVRKGRQERIRSDKLACSFAILDPQLSMYPFYPTMVQVFNVFLDLFCAAVCASDQDMQSAVDLLRRLEDAAHGLEKDISDLDARSALFEVGYEVHTRLKKAECPIRELADTLSFRYSLTSGSAASALFTSWIDGFDEMEKAHIIRLVNGMDGQQAGTFEEARQSLRRMIHSMGLALSVEQTGLLISDDSLCSVTDSKKLQALLIRANQPDRTEHD